MFVASGPDDPNAPQEDKTKELEPEVEKTPEKPPVSVIHRIGPARGLYQRNRLFHLPLANLHSYLKSRKNDLNRMKEVIKSKH